MGIFTRNESDIEALKVKAAVHDQQIGDHDKVLVSIQEHLGALVDKIDGFERRLTILTCVIAAGVLGNSSAVAGLARSLGLG